MAQSSPMPIFTALFTDAAAIRRIRRIKLLSVDIKVFNYIKIKGL